MANQKITELTALTGANVDDSDVVAIVDVAPTATTKKMTRTEFFKNLPDITFRNVSGQIEVETGNTTSHLDFDFINVTTAAVSPRFFRNTTTTGIRRVVFHKGDGTATVDAQIGVDGTDTFFGGGGNVGIGNASPSEKLDVTGNVTISGSISKGSGSFRIDHPLKPDTHHLVHSFIEGPQADNLYRGKVALVDGQATINLDEAGRMSEGTFAALNGNVQCFTTNEDGWTAVRGSVSGNILTVEAQDTTCTDTVSWLVIGERHDQHMLDTTWTDDAGRIIVEPEKVVVHPNQEVSEEE